MVGSAQTERFHDWIELRIANDVGLVEETLVTQIELIGSGRLAVYEHLLPADDA